MSAKAKALLHYYRQARAHQVETYSLPPRAWNVPREGTGGGACYGLHAYAAFLSAKRALHFRKVYR